METKNKEDGKVKKQEPVVETQAGAKVAAKPEAKKAEVKEQSHGPVTLASVEKDLFSLSAKVDLLTKARAKAGKPSRALFILKKRLDTLILLYSKFNKGSVE